MCGIAIQYKDHPCDYEKIAHRGIIKGFLEVEDYKIHHYKLPLQTKVNDEFNQPIRLKNGNILLYNGEIFNVAGCFKNDVHYLINFFQQEDWLDQIGGEEYNEWDGFWGIVIITPKEVYAFTDPLGKKQLYFRNGCISSEIKPLMDERTEIDSNFDFQELKTNCYTPFTEIHRIIPNVLHKFKGTKCSSIKYNLFDLEKKPECMDLEKLMDQSVKNRLINRLDSNTLFISGGLDSTILMYHIHKLGLLSNFQLLTIDNTEDNKYIEVLESYFDCIIERIPQRELMPSEIEHVLKSYEYPIEKGSLFQQYRLCKNSIGSVIYSGDGADELFSGYSRALEVDSQEYDVFVELPYYHNLRLDRICMSVTKENRSPFLSHEIVRYAMNKDWNSRRGKKILRQIYEGKIPESILNRKKVPLREDFMIEDRKKYVSSIANAFKLIRWMN